MEHRMPPPHNRQKHASPVRIVIRKSVCVSKVIEWPFMNTDSKTVMIVMLVIMPRVRMLPTSPDATPRYLGATLPIITLMLGDENRAKPSPSSKKMTTRTVRDVDAEMAVLTPRPAAQSAMPPVATPAAEYRSERRPQSGENRAWAMG